jgi:hypothetical protein
VESAKGQVILRPVFVSLCASRSNLDLSGEDADSEGAVVVEETEAVSDEGVFRRLCAAAIRLGASGDQGQFLTRTGSNQTGSTGSWLLDADLAMAADPALQRKAQELLDLLKAPPAVSGQGSRTKPPQLVQDWGAVGICGAMGLWMRQRVSTRAIRRFPVMSRRVLTDCL